MLKRILSLGLAVTALAVVAPAIVSGIGLGGGVAHAQTPPDGGDPPEAPDTPEAPDPPEAPDTPDAPDPPAAPDTPDAPAAPEAPDTPDAPDTPAAPAPPAQPDDSSDDPCAGGSRVGAHASGEDDNCPPAPLQAPVEQGPVSAPQGDQNSGDTPSPASP